MGTFKQIFLAFIFIILSLYVFLTYIHQFSQDDQIEVQPVRPFQMLQFPSQQYDPFLHSSTKILFDQRMKTPEDLQVDQKTGTIYSGLYDGRIIRIVNEDIKTFQVIGKSEGQILGFQFSRDKKSLLFMTSGVGIQKLNLQTLQITTILDEIDGVKMNTIAPNSIVQTINGDYYFTVSSDKIVMKQYIKDIIRNRPNGKLYFYSPSQNKLQKIVDGLYFANGIMLQKDQQSVLVAQSTMYRVVRIWITGQKKGKTEILIDNLPGLTDNIQLNQNQQLWVPLAGWRSLISEIAYNTKFLRNIVVYFGIQYIFEKFGDFKHIGGAKVDTKTGKIIQWIVGSSKHLKFSTTLLEKNGKLYVSSLKTPAILIIDLKSARNLAKSSQKQSSDL